MTPIPSRDDINVHDSLDERTAEAHFSGLDIEAAARLISENPLRYLEDLMWMGPTAFTYYLSAASQSVLNGEGDPDPDAISGLIVAMEFHLEHHAASIVPSLQAMKQLALTLRDGNVDPGLAPRLSGLVENIARLVPGTDPDGHAKSSAP